MKNFKNLKAKIQEGLFGTEKDIYEKGNLFLRPLIGL